MKRGSILLALALGIGSAAVSGQALAHAALKSSSPKNGDAVTAPDSLNLQFDHPTRLTKLKLTTSGQEIPVPIDASAPAATSFTVRLPVLAPGRYELRWSTMGDDGHPMTGNLSFGVIGK